MAQKPHGTAYGLRASDGRIAWEFRPPPGCGEEAEAHSPGSLVYLLQCAGPAGRLVSVDPATGIVSWQQVVGKNAVQADSVTGVPGPLLVTRYGDIIAQI